MRRSPALFLKRFDPSKFFRSLPGVAGEKNPVEPGGSFLSNQGFGFGSFQGGLPANLAGGFATGSRDSGAHGEGAGGKSGQGPGAGFGGGSFGGPFSGLFDKALEWCSEAHARDIARRQGIDIRDIRFEKTAEGGINVVVDAPNATPKQIEQLGEQVMEECPVARFRKTQVTSPQEKIQWLRLPDRYDR
ncbi:uncharacterized protein TM35_000321620 [Trypanosoma theileri]|uniref:Uncharacterized protein n=1 Tax=Trypanosoma theileri TaxID=67003 RepID=A0A1X0NMD9_9TRYP|nr:uncharacterized protein TM35_000321620 [Trypanosoma theileri]ORC85847.1 hypothetical protein TM35_000321620 [Trypanosoma theileri]